MKKILVSIIVRPEKYGRTTQKHTMVLVVVPVARSESGRVVNRAVVLPPQDGTPRSCQSGDQIARGDPWKFRKRRSSFGGVPIR